MFESLPTGLQSLSTAQQLLDEGFEMPFKAHLLRIELDAEGKVLPLLKRVRELAELKEAPTGRRGCEDCRKLVDLVGLL